MGKLNASGFFSHISGGPLAPAYLLAGEEGFLIDRALERILSRSVEHATRDFNLDIFYARDSRAEDIAAQAQTLPMMAAARTVVVKEADRLRDMGPIKEYMESPSPSTVLVLVAEGAERAKEAALSRLLGRDAVTVHFYRPTDAEVGRWIASMAKDCGYKVEPDTTAYLKDVLGDNLALIEAELKKVFNFAGTRKTVTIGDAREAVGDFGLPAVFELVDQVADSRTGKALDTLNRLLREGEQPMMVLGMLSRHWRRLLEARERMELGDGPAEIEKRFGLNFKNRERFLRQTKKLESSALRQGFSHLGKADYALKSSPLPDRLVMERLVMELSGSGGF